MENGEWRMENGEWTIRTGGGRLPCGQTAQHTPPNNPRHGLVRPRLLPKVQFRSADARFETAMVPEWLRGCTQAMSGFRACGYCTGFGRACSNHVHGIFLLRAGSAGANKASASVRRALLAIVGYGDDRTA